MPETVFRRDRQANLGILDRKADGVGHDFNVTIEALRRSAGRYCLKLCWLPARLRGRFWVNYLSVQVGNIYAVRINNSDRVYASSSKIKN